MHYSDEREPKSSSKTHWSVPQVHNFNKEENAGSEHDSSREHVRVQRDGKIVRTGQAVAQDYKLREE